MAEPSRASRCLSLALYMILMGLLAGWVFALAIPLAMEQELSASAVNSLPVYGFAGGAALGLGMYFHAGIREVVLIVLGSIVTGALVWFFSVLLLRGVLLIVEVPEETVDALSEWVGPVVFAIGVLLGIFTALVIVYDKLDPLLRRAKSRRARRE